MKNVITGITWGMTYWPLWILFTTLTFAGPEAYALVTNPRNTLSDFAWKEFGFPLNGPLNGSLYTAAWYASFALYISTVVFLGIHIWFEKLR